MLAPLVLQICFIVLVPPQTTKKNKQIKNHEFCSTAVCTKHGTLRFFIKNSNFLCAHPHFAGIIIFFHLSPAEWTTAVKRLQASCYESDDTQHTNITVYHTIMVDRMCTPPPPPTCSGRAGGASGKPRAFHREMGRYHGVFGGWERIRGRSMG